MIDTLLGGLLAAFWFLIATFILVVGHEFGHFWVARKLGVRTLRFSVGFGSRPLWQRTGADGTQYWLSPIPLGGYVKFVDAADPAVDAGARPFLSEAVWKRMLIVVAGPLVNLLLAIFFFWAMYMVGVRDLQPVLGQPEGAAAAAGLRAGDRIVEVESVPIDSWTGAFIALVDHSFDRPAVGMIVQRGEARQQVQISLDAIPADRDESKLLTYLGLNSIRTEPRIGEVVADTPAARAGLQPGDRVLSLDGKPVATDNGFSELLQRQAPAQEGRVVLGIQRGADTLEVTLQAVYDSTTDPSRPGWRIGIRWHEDYLAYASIHQHGPSEALVASLGFIRTITYNSLHMLYRMLTREASTGNISGPVTIARVARDAAEQGLPYFLRILGLISLTLCIVNLLPVPMLDGGQLLYYLIEAIRGRPLSERMQIAGQYVGLVAIFGLVTIALYNDLARLLVPQ